MPITPGRSLPAGDPVTLYALKPFPIDRPLIRISTATSRTPDLSAESLTMMLSSASAMRMMIRWGVLCGISLVAHPGLLPAGEYRDLGRPVIGAWQRFSWLVHDPVLKRDVLWSQESSQDGAVLYGLDARTGKVVDEHPIPAREVGGLLRTAEGVLYLYTYSGLTHPGNELLRFDPHKRRIERLGLAPTPRNRCISGVIAPDGNVYIGTHQQGRLFRFDTDAATWTDLGQKVPAPVRPGQNTWLDNLQVLSSSRLIGSVVRQPPAEVVEINLQDNSFRKVDAIHSRNFIVHGNRILNPTPDGFEVFDDGFDKQSDVTFDSLNGPPWHWKNKPVLSLISAGANYGIIARLDRLVIRIDLQKRSWQPIADLPFEGEFCFHRAGTLAACVDHPRRRYALFDLKANKVSVVRIGYAGKRGTQICGLSRGLDGAIYGTNIIGMHVFHCDTETDRLTDLGHVGWRGGEVYNTIQYDHRVYFGTYGGGHWGVYDSRKPWKPDFDGQGTLADANPRYLGRLGGDEPDAVNRPFEYVIGPRRRLYIASRANYGHPGGSLIEFDPLTGKQRVFRDQIRSVQTVTADDRYVFGGTNIHGGRGSGDRAEEGTLFVFDPDNGERVFERPVVEGAVAIVCVRYNPADKRVYATTDNQFLLRFHPREFKIEKTWKLRQAGTPLAGVPEDVGMLHITAAADGNVYGIAYRDLYRLDTKTDKLQYLETPPRSGLYQIVEGKPGEFYMGAGTHLLKYVVTPATYFR